MKGLFSINIDDMVKGLKENLERDTKQEIDHAELKVKLKDDKLVEFKELYVEFETK